MKNKILILICCLISCLSIITHVYAADGDPVSGEINVSANIVRSTTSLIVSPVAGYYHDQISLSANLTDTIYNEPVVGKNIIFSVSGVIVGNATTNSFGVASLSYNIGQDSGAYSISASFAGDDVYFGSEGLGTLTVNFSPTQLTVASVSGKNGDTVTLSANLTNTHLNNPINAKQIYFSVNGIPVGSSMTDSHGIAMYDYKITQNPGAYNISAVFNNDPIYVGSSGSGILTVNTIPVPTPPEENKIIAAIEEIKKITEAIADSNAGKTAIVSSTVAVAAAVGASAIISASVNLPFLLTSPLISLINYLLYLFTSLLSYLGIYKHSRKWGRILDSASKKPIAGAVVQLYETEFNRLIQTTVSDKLGRFSFLTKPGDYFIKVTKEDYTYPSVIFRQGYHGEVIRLKQYGKMNLEIYIDFKTQTLATKIKVLNKILFVLRYVTIPLLVLGTFLSAVFVIATARPLDIIVFCSYGLIWIVEALKLFQVRSVGHIYAVTSNKPLDLSIVRLFDESTGRLITTQVSDSMGRFSILAKQGVYRLTVLRDGFKPFEKKNVRLSQAGSIDTNIFLQKI